MRCPVCHEEIEFGLDITPDVAPRKKPRPGDLGLCENCRSWFRHGTDGTLRQLSNFEWLMMSDAKRRRLTILRDKVIR